MGHLNHHKAYRDLQARIDKTQGGFPATEATMAILHQLFTPEEAELVAQLPLSPRSVTSIARRVGKDTATVQRLLNNAADRGLILDVYDAKRDRSYYCVAPPVVGFVEFSLMRRRSDIDQAALAAEMDRLFEQDREFVETFFDGETQIGRTLVHEDTLQPDDISELLTMDRAEELVREASTLAVSLCYCRHKAEHLGHRCDKPMDNCMSMGIGAKYVIRHGHGKPIDQSKAIEILHESRENDLVFIADNVQRKVTYICSCCGCCCGQLQAINRTGLNGVVKTSPFIATIDAHKCTGCGRCARACPIQAMRINALPPHVERKARMYTKVDESVCLGCGVCVSACKKKALSMVPRPERTLTPQTTLERIISMALERDRLQHLLFDDLDGLHMAFLNRLTGAVLRMPRVKRALMSDQLKSRFVNFLAQGARTAMTGTKPV